MPETVDCPIKVLKTVDYKGRMLKHSHSVLLMTIICFTTEHATFVVILDPSRYLWT